MDLDLILGVQDRSCGLDPMGRGERQRATAGDKTRGGAARGSPEKAIPAFPWLIRAEVWLWSMPVAHVIHWWP